VISRLIDSQEPLRAFGNARLPFQTGLGQLPLCLGSYGKIADIGSADADLAFFMKKMGFSVDVIDNALTNFNLLEGARIMKEALGSSVTIREIDLDSQFPLSTKRYDAIFPSWNIVSSKEPFLRWGWSAGLAE
jgi:tRNA (mo5U34)-methyltransferase